MSQVIAVLLPGLALGGVIAAGAAWSRAVRPGVVPHLGVGAVGAVGMGIAGRVIGVTPPAAVVLVVTGGIAAGTVIWFLERVLTERVRLLPVQLVDVAVLALLIGAAQLLRPPTALALPLGPLGGQPGTWPAVAAMAAGLVGALGLLGPWADRLGGGVRWAGFGGLVAITAALASGAVGGAGIAGMALPPVTDAGALALRATAAALAGRDPADAAAAGIGLGLAEAVVRQLDPMGGTALLPAAVAGLFGLAAWARAYRAAGLGWKGLAA